MKKPSSNFKRETGKKILAAGVVCVLAALALLTYNTIMDHNAESFSASVMREIEQYISSVNDTDNASDAERYDYVFDGRDDSGLKFQGYGFLGYLSIDKLGLKLPVMTSWPAAFAASSVRPTHAISGEV